MAQEDQVISRWIAQRLAGDGYIAGQVAGRIYDTLGDETDGYPRIVYQMQTARDLRVVGAYKLWVSTTWLVRGIMETSSYESLAGLADRIDLLLDRQRGETAGGVVLSCVRVAPFRLIEPGEGQQFRHLGGMYSIQAQGV